MPVHAWDGCVGHHTSGMRRGCIGHRALGIGGRASQSGALHVECDGQHDERCRVGGMSGYILRSTLADLAGRLLEVGGRGKSLRAWR